MKHEGNFIVGRPTNYQLRLRAVSLWRHVGSLGALHLAALLADRDRSFRISSMDLRAKERLLTVDHQLQKYNTYLS